MVLNKIKTLSAICFATLCEVSNLIKKKKKGRSNTEETFTFELQRVTLVYRLKWNSKDTNSKEPENTLVYATELGCSLL